MLQKAEITSRCDPGACPRVQLREFIPLQSMILCSNVVWGTGPRQVQRAAFIISYEM